MATNGANTRLQAQSSDKANRIVTWKDQLGEEKTKSKNLAEEDQELRTGATQRTKTTEAEFQKNASKNIGKEAPAEMGAESEDFNAAHS